MPTALSVLDCLTALHANSETCNSCITIDVQTIYCLLANKPPLLYKSQKNQYKLLQLQNQEQLQNQKQLQNQRSQNQQVQLHQQNPYQRAMFNRALMQHKQHKQLKQQALRQTQKIHLRVMQSQLLPTSQEKQVQIAMVLTTYILSMLMAKH